jgi:hypothetical protein
MPQDDPASWHLTPQLVSDMIDKAARTLADLCDEAAGKMGLNIEIKIESYPDQQPVKPSITIFHS